MTRACFCHDHNGSHQAFAGDSSVAAGRETSVNAENICFNASELLCACACVCVCVEHLKRCKTSNLLVRFFENFVFGISYQTVTAGGQSHVCS